MEMTAAEKIVLVEKITGTGVVWDEEDYHITLRIMNLMYHVLYHGVTYEKRPRQG